jgi:pimeloyl-ACP methyl ester carboxylesterase
MSSWKPIASFNPVQKINNFSARVAGGSVRALYRKQRQMLDVLGFQSYLAERFLSGGLMPSAQALVRIQADVAGSLLAACSGEKQLRQHFEEMSRKLISASRYHQLVTSMGRELFGSATFPGEVRLAENDFLTLTYIPPAQDAEQSDAALFHVGGFLPFSDRIFRFLPEANLYANFSRRGMPVYAMALKGTHHAERALNNFTTEAFIDMISEMSAAAYEHNERRKMIIEGYCGLGMPALCYLAAHPREAEERFNVAFTMVSPIDGRECEGIGQGVKATPADMRAAGFILSELTSGYVPGQSLLFGIDVPFGSWFYKTVAGRFFTGWLHEGFADVQSVDDLDPRQRRELAGAYWVSAENIAAFAIPVDLARLSERLWVEGVSDDLELPCRYRGRRLSLRDIVEQTNIHLLGFYGGRDRVVPERTAHVLVRNLGDRYTHVVHPDAGHISYVLSPEMWEPGSDRSLDPNPVDLVLDRWQAREQQRRDAAS